jgi:hypothetical protein
MPVRTSGGIFNQQILTGGLSHWVICGADFSGAINSYGRPVPGSAAEIIFVNLEDSATIDIMNPNSQNLSFALEENRSTWDEISMTSMIQELGTNVGVDDVNCSICIAKQVPYIWGCNDLTTESFLNLTDTPKTYVGAAGYIVTVNSTETGLIFTPASLGTFSYDFIEVPTQTTLSAITSDILTIIPGNNVTITTDFSANSLTINATGDVDYTPVLSGTTLNFSTRYLVTGPFPVSPLAFVILPLATGSDRPPGTSVIIAKPANGNGPVSLLVNTQGSDIINTDIGTTNSLEFDATQEIIFIFDGTSTWNLQIGSVNL